jgi:hypothetical protein
MPFRFRRSLTSMSKRYGDDDVALVRPALRVAALPDSWKEYFGERRERTRTRAADLTAKIFQTC